MRNKFLGLMGILFITLACGFGTRVTQTQPELETIVASTLTAFTSAPQEAEQLTPDGVVVNTTEVSFFIPNGIANDATSSMTTDVEYPYINPSFGDMPQHVKLTLNLYALTGTQFEPHIMIFRSAEYAQYGEGNADVMSAMQSLQYVDGQPLPENLSSDFSAQIHAVNFENGHGVRYLTQVFTNFLPVNNKELFYYYQGMTNDGQYYVQAILPINAPFLPADDNPNTPLPMDGIPFNTDDFSGYLNTVAQRLDSTDTFSYTPYLEYLDAMIQSTQVIGY